MSSSLKDLTNCMSLPLVSRLPVPCAPMASQYVIGRLCGISSPKCVERMCENAPKKTAATTRMIPEHRTSCLYFAIREGFLEIAALPLPNRQNGAIRQIAINGNTAVGRSWYPRKSRKPSRADSNSRKDIFLTRQIRRAT